MIQSDPISPVKLASLRATCTGNDLSRHGVGGAWGMWSTDATSRGDFVFLHNNHKGRKHIIDRAAKDTSIKDLYLQDSTSRRVHN